MPRQFSNRYTLVFVGGMGVLCALLLAVAAGALRGSQEANVVLDQRKNILDCLGVFADGQLSRQAAPAALNQFYAEHVHGLVVNRQGEVVPDVTADEVVPYREERERAPSEQRLPVYVMTAGGQPVAYAIPVFGPGLWGTIFGYLALDQDLDHVRGLTFYAHKETPGLGAEIDRPWFQDQFRHGLRVFAGGQLRSVTVVKGKAAQVHPEAADRPYYVDGISGATKTSDGVTNLLRKDLAKYENWLRRERAAEGH